MRLSAWHVPIETLSASSVSLLISCPELWRLRKIKKIPESRGLDKFIGIIDHHTHEANFRAKVKTDLDFSRSQMEATYARSWQDEISDEGDPDWNEADPRAVYDHGQLMVSTYMEQVAATVHPIAVESRFEERLEGVPVPIVGYTDVEERTRLIERKTTKTRLSKPKPQWLLQGRIYNLVAAKPVEWQIVTRAKTPAVCTPETDPGLRLEAGNHDSTLQLLQQASYMLNDFWLRYGPDNHWPLHGLLHPFQCSYCPAGPTYGNFCVAWGGKDDA